MKYSYSVRGKFFNMFFFWARFKNRIRWNWYPLPTCERTYFNKYVEITITNFQTKYFAGTGTTKLQHRRVSCSINKIIPFNRQNLSSNPNLSQVFAASAKSFSQCQRVNSRISVKYIFVPAWYNIFFPISVGSARVAVYAPALLRTFSKRSSSLRERKGLFDVSIYSRDIARVKRNTRAHGCVSTKRNLERRNSFIAIWVNIGEEVISKRLFDVWFVENLFANEWNSLSRGPPMEKLVVRKVRSPSPHTRKDFKVRRLMGFSSRYSDALISRAFPVRANWQYLNMFVESRALITRTNNIKTPATIVSPPPREPQKVCYITFC